MKKNTKIFFIIVFLLLVFGITTSVTASVRQYPNIIGQNEGYVEINVNTSDDVMFNALKNNYNLKLKGDSGNAIRDGNESLICRQPGLTAYKNSEYTFDKTAEQTIENIKKSYPYDSNSDGKNDDGYAEAYILTANLHGNIKSDEDTSAVTEGDAGQFAWYVINGLESGTNDFLETAKAYEAFKKKESNIRVVAKGTTYTVTEAQQTIEVETTQIQSEQGMVYGPINIYYNYGHYTKGKILLDEWGGFDYAFFDESGTNISKKVSLCTLSSDGTYTSISSANDYVNNYYEVRTSNYASTTTTTKNLYVVTNQDFNDIKINIRQNKVDYQATTYPLVGEYHETNARYAWCEDCQAVIDNAKTYLRRRCVL